MHFMHYMNFKGVLYENYWAKFYLRLKAMLRIDTTVEFSSHTAIKMHRQILKLDHIKDPCKRRPVMYYVRLGRLSLSDCFWDYTAFRNFKTVFETTDIFIFKRMLFRFNANGVTYEAEECLEDDYLERLVAYQNKETFYD